MEKIEIKEATQNDTTFILKCITGLADNVGQRDFVTATEDQLRKYIFSDNKFMEVRIAFLNENPVGFVLFFKTFSTFKAKPGLYLEDLFVLPEHRNKRIGTRLLEYVIEYGKEHDYNKVEWYVNNRNIKAIDFYKKMKAKQLDYKSIYYIQL